MTRFSLILLCVMALGACGVDGEPVAPSVSGGVTVSNSGVYPHANVGVNQGPVSVNVGLGRWAWGYW
jgi:hypothetical protein